MHFCGDEALALAAAVPLIGLVLRPMLARVFVAYARARAYVRAYVVTRWLR